ncbi:DUF1043 family protein [Vibrio cincinnatiensis]|jgi:hypothetical protein|uniref:Z-ring associated protein G n=1 Tax=Vibrio cincinnatiensis DSM 19608 TaxID=1123491 RepID=A0A1T4N0D7_VIBCI|nr:Z-ring associated protein ZapG [Vibrio cincinnatiensis]MCG3721245.1 DUF1043 family protein [Vibrio cincinnatiensis]MCG3725948.1 DUF1043 family protein [Vibrio cincinnatiensis]MCG3733307.1 DUF1043 family protein [Vibrio cincinnatiensis]MCG3735249.1 DUF1043 family protein [Vibrio cincinnatiensis]MCG3740594.1 DUF1043 family protein [Vibrio cincinnatiensis]
MPWIYAVVGLLVGMVVGVVIARLTTPHYKNQKSLQKELDNTKFAMEQQRQELADHFAHTAEMLDTLGKDYTKLYQHMAKTSSDLLSNLPEQDNPFLKKIAQQNQETSLENDEENLEQPPKDYALGATGLLKNEEKAILHTSEVISQKPN